MKDDMRVSSIGRRVLWLAHGMQSHRQFPAAAAPYTLPFIKLELRRDNPTRIPDRCEWWAVATETGALDLNPILIDLQRGR